MGHAGAPVGVIEAVTHRAVGLRDLRAAVRVVESPARRTRTVRHAGFAPRRVIRQADSGIVREDDAR